MNHQRIVGVILLIAGALLLAHQLEWFDLSGQNFIGILSLLIGLSFFKKALANPERQGVLGGTFFVLFGLAVLFMNVSTGPFKRALLVGIIFVCLAIANLAYFLATSWKRNINIFMFFFFGAIGGSVLAVYYNVIDVWQFEDLASTYWPIILIVLGAIILIDSLVQKNKRIKEDRLEMTRQEKEEES